MSQRRACVKGPLRAGGHQAQGLPLPTNGETILRGVRGQGSARKGLVQLEGRELPECRGQHGGPPVEGTWGWKHLAQSRAQRTSARAEERGETGRQDRVAGGSVCPGVQPSGPTSHAGTSMPPAGRGEQGPQMCPGMAWQGVQRVQRMAVGWKQQSVLAREKWGNWHVGQVAGGAQSNARCCWSRGEAGSWRGIWLSCWRCMRAVGTRAQ